MSARLPSPDNVTIVGIGASAGGLEAATQLLGRLEPALPCAYVLLQHLSPSHRSLMVDILQRETRLTVQEATHGAVPMPGVVYVVPAHSNVVLKDGRLHMSASSAESVPRPSVNLFFISLAAERHEGALGIVLSGTGSDGTAGLRAIQAAGGITLAQEPASAKYDGMPRAAIDAGVADHVLDPGQIAATLPRLLEQTGLIGAPAPPDVLDAVLAQLKDNLQLDFSGYKVGTLMRRVRRRVTATGLRDLPAYVQMLQRDPRELDLLARDILISVTAFFRDRDAFAELDRTIRELVARKPAGQEFRAWVAGCATGEEAYSVAMLFAEALGERLPHQRVQIFATDIDDDALAVARRGIYTEGALAEVPPALLARHFREVDDHLEVATHLREMVVFARHNLVSDPPFLRLDLISCRNVLIYFDAPLQSQVFHTFHFGLQPTGVLFLGRSESVSLAEQMFVPVNRRERIFARSGEAALSLPQPPSMPARALPARRERKLELMLAAFAQRFRVTGALCDAGGNIVHTVGQVDRYFQFPVGDAKTAATDVIVAPLRGELLRLMQRCRQLGGAQRGRRRRVGDERLVLQVQRTGDGENAGWLVLVESLPEAADERAEPASARHASPAASAAASSVATSAASSAASSVGHAARAREREARDAAAERAALEEDLATTREHLEALAQQMATAHEEMQALNEEAQASNEELQAANEELETANEELQATNEELVSLNDELGRKSAELARLAQEYGHLYDALQFPVMVFDRGLQLMRYNRAAAQTLDLRPTALRQSVHAIRWPHAFGSIATVLQQALHDGDAVEHTLVRHDRTQRLSVVPGLDALGEVGTLVACLLDVSDVVSAQRALSESQGRLSALMDQTRLLFAMKDMHGNYVYANQAFQTFFGFDPATPYVGRNDFALLPRELAADLWAQDLAALRDRTPHMREHQVAHDGSVRWLRSVHQLLLDAQGAPSAFIVELEDVTELKHAERQLRITARVFDQAGDAIVVTDPRGRIETVNAAFVRMAGWSVEELEGQPISLLQSGRHSSEFFQRLWHALHTSHFWQGEVWSRHKTGDLYSQWVSINRIDDEHGQPMHYVAVYSDIESLKGSQRKTDYLATHDPLTGLPNRELFHDRLRQALAQARRSKLRAAVIFIDLDNFKSINDTQGHDIGDQLLRQVAQRFGHAVRDVDTVARMGGDEFTVILSECEPESAEYVARRIIEELNKPIVVGGGRELFVGASVGVALYPDDGADSASLVKAADSAMYSAKELGRNRVVFFKPSLQVRMVRHAQVEAALREALRDGHFRLVFQPKYALRHGSDGELVGAEALLRWHDERLGEMDPSEFVPLAEASSLIVALTRAVQGLLAEHVRSWLALGLTVPPIAFNVSPRSIREPDFARDLLTLLAAHEVPRHQVRIEITEGALVETSAAVVDNLARLNAAGVEISIDDFGTGYSSLGYLKLLPLSELKIDKRFVDGLGVDREDEAIARAVIGLARALDLRTVAEGVENERQRRWLAEHQCDQAQGFLFSRPLTPEQFEDLLARRALHA